MSLSEERPTSSDEVDLRKLLVTIGRGWKLILIFMAIGAIFAGAYHFLKQPVYQASSTISIDGSTLLTKTSPIFLIQSDEIQQEVIQALGITIDELPEISFSNDKLDKTIITITARSDDMDLSVDTVNTWAEISIKNINARTEFADEEIQKAQALIDTADLNLANYQKKNKLENLTWVDLQILTGVVEESTITVIGDSKELPTLTVSQKTALSNLVRQKILAGMEFHFINKRLYKYNIRRITSVVIKSERRNQKKQSFYPLIVDPWVRDPGFDFVWFLDPGQGLWKNSASNPTRAIK